VLALLDTPFVVFGLGRTVSITQQDSLGI
jgi:hypothetical protein